MKKAAAIRPAAERIQRIIAPGRLILPVGKCLPAVLGLSASNLRSAIRLNAIAHVRAQTMQARMSPNFLQPGQPRLSLAATTIAARANGSAKIVCENFTNSAHFLILFVAADLRR